MKNVKNPSDIMAATVVLGFSVFPFCIFRIPLGPAALADQHPKHLGNISSAPRDLQN